MAGPSTAIIKRLFAASGNQCAFPDCTQPLVTSGKVTGHICHIKARSPGGPRYDPEQSDEERHGFDNLVLMCPAHHDVIDADAEIYTVERLWEIKREHEERNKGGPEPSEEVAWQFLANIGLVVGPVHTGQGHIYYQAPSILGTTPTAAERYSEQRTGDSNLLGVDWRYRDSKLLRDYFSWCAKYDSFFEDHADLDQTKVYDYFIASGLAGVRQDGGTCLTHAGVLLCCKQDHIPRHQLHVRFSQKPDDRKEEVVELFGSVLFLYKELYERLRLLWQRRVGSPDVRDDIGGEKVFFDYPEAAIVEALVNLLIHRDYSLDDIAFITVYSDRVEFMNPGQSEIPPEELLSATSPLRPLYHRNPRLIEAMNKARLNQRVGSGILRIRRELEGNESFLPDGSLGLSIENDPSRNRFILTIYKRPAPISFVPVSSLHQLPSPPPDFTGREAELAKLTAAIEQGGATISSLRGMGGVGKTALALKLAQGLTSRYPDAQIYLDLKGMSPEPLSPAKAMAHVVRAYQPTARLPESEAELSALYRSVLHGQRAILLIDNAAGAAQVEPLLPPASCLLLVTSRQHLTLPGLYPLNLDTLRPSDASALLLKIAAHIGDCAEEMAELCGYLPLALRLSGSVLAERADLSPADYLGRLRDARTRLNLVEASLSLSYDLLDEEMQHSWCLLAVFSGTFDVLAAAAVWEIGDDRAQDSLSELVRYSLVEWNPEAERYRMHDLARLFAAERLGEEEREAGQRRHAAHYAAVLSAANALYLQGGESLLQGLALFDLEWDNVQAGQAWAAERAGEDDEAARLCSVYPDAGTYCLNLRQHPREWIRWLEEALDAARRLEDREAEGNRLGNLGLAYADLGQVERAIEYHQQALAIAHEIGDRRGEGNRLGNLGLAYADLGQVERAIEYYQQALAIAREIGDRRNEGAWLGNLGNAYAALGQVERAIEYYGQALAISRGIGDRRGEGNRLGNLGLAYADLGQVERAIEYYEQALAIAREIGDRRNEGAWLGNLGLAYAALGQVERAIEHHEQALAIAREIGDRRGEGSDLGNLGNVYAALGQVERAIEYHQQALAISREIVDRRGEGSHLGNLGNAYAALGQVARAIEHHEQALAISREIVDRRGEGSDLGNLGSAYAALGQVERAVEHYEQALAISREIGDRRGEGNHLGNLGIAYKNLGQVERAIEQYEQALGIHREIGDRRGEGNDLANMGLLAQQQGDSARAGKLWQQALAIYEAIKDPNAERVRGLLARLAEGGHK
jgi:tetratricopeptide (TPR) repeat protein